MTEVLLRSWGKMGLLVAASTMCVVIASLQSQVLAQGKAADNALQDRIERRFQTDPALRRYDLRVKVDNGDLKIRGTVATDDQKRDAERLARLAGIDHVSNDISVDKDADQVLANRAGKGLSRTGEAVTDSSITAKVRWFFIDEPLLDGSKIDVDTKRHVVTLDGKVMSEEARARANELASYPDGVTKVVDKLKIDKD